MNLTRGVSGRVHMKKTSHSCYLPTPFFFINPSASTKKKGKKIKKEQKTNQKMSANQKKKKKTNSQGSQDPPRKKQNFRNEEDSFLQKKTPQKKFFPPQQAVVARFARASLTATERRGGSILRDSKKRKSNPFSCTIRSTNRTKPIRLPEAGADATAGNFLKMAKFLQIWSHCIFLAAKCKGIQKHYQLYFFAEQKNNINGAAGEKKLRYGVKMLPFTPQNHSTNPFFE